VLQLRIAQVLRYREIARNQRLARQKHKAELRRKAMKQHHRLLDDASTHSDAHSNNTRAEESGQSDGYAGKEKTTSLDTPKGPEMGQLKRKSAMAKDVAKASVELMTMRPAFRGMRRWGWGWGVVWDVGGVIGPLLYHTHVPCRLAAADALEGGCIAMMQKVIRFESRARLERDVDSDDEGEDQLDPAYHARVFAAVHDALHEVVTRWRQELTGQWLVRCHQLILRVEPEKHSEVTPGRIYLHSEALGHPSPRPDPDAAASSPQQRTVLLWSSATDKEDNNGQGPEHARGVGGGGWGGMGGAGGEGGEAVAKDREEMYRQLRSLVPHVASLGWLNRLLRQGVRMTPESLRARLLEHRAEQMFALTGIDETSTVAMSTHRSNIMSARASARATSRKKPKVLTVQGQRLLQRLVDEGLEKSAVALLGSAHDDEDFDRRKRRATGPQKDGREECIHVCGTLCRQIGLWQVHEQQRREILAIDEVLAVSNAELQRHFHVFAAILDENFSLPPGYLSHDWESGRGARMVGHDSGCDDDGHERREEKEVEEGEEWGMTVRTLLGWGVQQFRDDLKLAKKHWALHAMGTKARGAKATPFKAWYLTEWQSERLWPSRQAAWRFAELIVRVSWHSTHARNAALKAVTHVFHGAPAEVRSLAALCLSQVQVPGEHEEDASIVALMEKLCNAAQYGASPDDYLEEAKEVKPSAYIAQAEYIVSPLNCWIDGVLVVKAGQKGQEEQWKMDADSIVAEPTAYAQFATRHPEVAVAHEELMAARYKIVQENWDLKRMLALEMRVLALEMRVRIRQGQRVLQTHLPEQERQDLPPGLLESDDTSEEDEEEDVRVKRRQHKASPHWLANRQARAEKGSKSPEAPAWCFADLVLRKMVAALHAEIARLYELQIARLSELKNEAAGASSRASRLTRADYKRQLAAGSGGGEGMDADLDALSWCKERARVLIEEVRRRLEDWRQKVAEKREALRAARTAALGDMSQQLDTLCEVSSSTTTSSSTTATTSSSSSCASAGNVRARPCTHTHTHTHTQPHTHTHTQEEIPHDNQHMPTFCSTPKP